MARAGAASAPPSRASGCLSKASKVTGARPPERRLGGELREPAGRRVGEPVAAGIVDRDLPALERGQHAAGERAVGRHQRRGLLRRLDRLAQRHRDRERFLFGIGGFDHGKPLERGFDLRLRSRTLASPCQSIGHCRRPQRLGQVALAAVRAPGSASAVTASRAIPIRRSSACMANCGCPTAGATTSRPAASRRPAISSHDSGVEIGVEAGQHHGAVRRAWRWSRSARRSPASSRSSRRRSPGRRCARQAAPLPP